MTVSVIQSSKLLTLPLILQETLHRTIVGGFGILGEIARGQLAHPAVVVQALAALALLGTAVGAVAHLEILIHGTFHTELP